MQNYTHYNLRESFLMNLSNGKPQVAAVNDVKGQHTGLVLKTLASELCRRGFSSIKGPDYANYTWHMSLGTSNKTVAKAV